MNDVLLLAMLKAIDAGDTDTADECVSLAADPEAVAALLDDDSEGVTDADLQESTGPKGPPPFPGAVFDPGRHRWVRGAGSDAQIAAMKRRELQRVAMQVGAPTTLKIDEPIETLKAAIMARTSSDTEPKLPALSGVPADAAKPGYVATITPEQAKAGRDRVIAARENPAIADDTKNISDERFAVVADNLVAAVNDHAKTMPDPNVGPPVSKLYSAVGPKHGLTPDEFRGAVQRLQRAGRVWTSGMSKTLADELRPDLLIVAPGGVVQSSVHPARPTARM